MGWVRVCVGGRTGGRVVGEHRAQEHSRTEDVHIIIMIMIIIMIIGSILLDYIL